MQLNARYASIRPLLECFIAHFQEKNEKLLAQCTPDKPIKRNSKIQTIDTTSDWLNSLDTFKATINPQKFYLYHEGKKIAISYKEFICLQLLIRNHSVKEIAFLLNNKTSTIYRHIENLRYKVQLQSTKHLLKIASANFLEGVF